MHKKLNKNKYFLKIVASTILPLKVAVTVLNSNFFQLSDFFMANIQKHLEILLNFYTYKEETKLYTLFNFIFT